MHEITEEHFSIGDRVTCQGSTGVITRMYEHCGQSMIEAANYGEMPFSAKAHYFRHAAKFQVGDLVAIVAAGNKWNGLSGTVTGLRPGMVDFLSDDHGPFMTRLDTVRHKKASEPSREALAIEAAGIAAADAIGATLTYIATPDTDMLNRDMREEIVATDIISAAFDVLKTSMQADEAYAWSWHCNLLPVVAGIPTFGHETENRRAAHLMRHLFEVDVTQFNVWKGFEREWAKAKKPQPPPGLTTVGPTPRIGWLGGLR